MVFALICSLCRVCVARVHQFDLNFMDTLPGGGCILLQSLIRSILLWLTAALLMIIRLVLLRVIGPSPFRLLQGPLSPGRIVILQRWVLPRMVLWVGLPMILIGFIWSKLLILFHYWIKGEFWFYGSSIVLNGLSNYWFLMVYSRFSVPSILMLINNMYSLIIDDFTN